MTTTTTYAHNVYNILIVDDTPANLSVLTFMLQQEGFRVRPAINGSVALMAVRAETPDLILLDIRMSDMSGYEVCQHLKEDASTRDIPVIFISALDDVEDKVKAFEAGGLDYITKPFHVEEVVARVRAHLTLQDQRRAIERLSNLKDDLMHIVAHDLKNPISVIGGYSEMLMDESYGLNPQETLGKIHATAAQMLVLVTTLLDYGRLEQDIPLTTKLQHIAPLIEDTVESFSLAAREKGIGVFMRFDTPDAAAMVDRDRLMQAVGNLVGNAVKYTQQNGQVDVTLNADKEYVYIHVADNGQGIPLEHLPHLFERFYRVPRQSREQGVAGTGLGLAIVKLIVEKHDGTVSVESEYGAGSRFTIRLPRIPV